MQRKTTASKSQTCLQDTFRFNYHLATWALLVVVVSNLQAGNHPLQPQLKSRRWTEKAWMYQTCKQAIILFNSAWLERMRCNIAVSNLQAGNHPLQLSCHIFQIVDDAWYQTCKQAIILFNREVERAAFPARTGIKPASRQSSSSTDDVEAMKLALDMGIKPASRQSSSSTAA